MIQLNKTYGSFQIFGMDGFFQCAIEMEAFFMKALFVKPELMPDDRTETVAGSAVRADTDKNDFPVHIIMFFEQVLQVCCEIIERLVLTGIKIFYHNLFLPF